MKQHIITTILVLAMLTCVVGSAEADTEISSCQIISAPGNYRLTNDILAASTSRCIEITADDVCLDLQGHTIDGDGTGNYGIHISRTTPTDSNITIKNGTVQNWRSSNIYLRNANENTLEDIQSFTSGYAGIQLRSTQRNNLTNVISDGNPQYGFCLYDTYNTRLTNLGASGNGAGIHFSYAAYNWLNDSDIADNLRVDVEVRTNDDYWCTNYLTNVTGSGGRPIGYYYDAATIENIEFSELLLCNADNSVISNVTVHGNDTIQNNGIYVLLTDNALFSDISSDHNDHGMSFRDSNHNNLTRIIAEHNMWDGLTFISSSSNQVSNSVFNNNTDHGVYLTDESPYNIISNIIANHNRIYGIYLQVASHNKISGSTFNNNSQGIQLIQNSSYNTFTDVDANLNTDFGIYICNTGLGSPDSNTFDSITANSNGWYGICINDASSNTIKNSHIINNDRPDGHKGYGISLRGDSLGENGANIVYNNIFENNHNIQVSDNVNHITALNITPTTGPNIIGGPEIGGNYWSDYTGTDADNDGFGDTPYPINGLALDHNPLVHSRVLCGDVVPDGNINILDLTELLNIVVAGDTIDPCTGDTDGNRDINILDVRRLIMHINDPAGSPLNCGC